MGWESTNTQGEWGSVNPQGEERVYMVSGGCMSTYTGRVRWSINTQEEGRGDSVL